MPIIQVDACECGRCNHLWLPAGRIEGVLPKRCARCKSPAWNSERARPAVQRNNGWVSVGFVYLMIDEALGCYKIGFSFEPKHREETLQAQKPTIRLLSSWSGTKRDERMLHARFADSRLRGEWFRLTDTDIAEIEQLLGRRSVSVAPEPIAESKQPEPSEPEKEYHDHIYEPFYD